MATHRNSPGERVTLGGTYALFDHYGTYAGLAVTMTQGQHLPLVATREGLESPLWFVLISEPSSAIKAA